MHLGPFLFPQDAVGRRRPEDVENPAVQGPLAAGQPTDMVDEGIVRHAEEPAPEPTFRPIVGVNLAQQLHVNLLDDVDGVGLGKACFRRYSISIGP